MSEEQAAAFVARLDQASAGYRDAMQAMKQQMQAWIDTFGPTVRRLREVAERMQAAEAEEFAGHPDVQEFAAYARGWYES